MNDNDRAAGNQCVECTNRTINRNMICDACAHLFPDPPFTDDIDPASHEPKEN